MNYDNRKIKGVGTLKTIIYKRKNPSKGFDRFVKLNGCLSGEKAANEIGMEHGEVIDLVNEIVRVCKAGYEIRLGHDDENCIRFFPLLSSDGTHFQLIARTMGDVKESLPDVGIMRFHSKNGDMIDDAEMRMMCMKRRYDYDAMKSRMVEVTPDLMITCPKCGFDKIRVGKALAKKGE